MKKNIILLTLGFIILIPFITNAQTSLSPIVLVPGIMGSWNTDVIIGNKTGEGTWDFVPTDHTWDNVISALTDAGYVMDETLFIAFYDWRQSNINSATDYLIPTIDRALANSTSTKVNIIAHSMGGLVARSYVQSHNYRNDVDKLVMLGTPNYGSSDVYTIWEGGRVPKNWDNRTRRFVDLVIDILNIKDITTDDEYDTVHKYIPSVGELLPTYDFLDEGNGNIKSYWNLTEATNPFLDNLNDPENTSNLLEIGHITAIAGTGTSTVGNIPVVDRPASETKLWSDGVPSPINPVRNSKDGDNRVLRESALLSDATFIPIILERNFLQKFFAWLVPRVQAEFDGTVDSILTHIEVDANHGGLPTIAIPEVFTALGLQQPTVAYVPPTEPESIASIWVASPVVLKVIDPQGRVITKESNQIPGAIFDSETDPNGVKMVMIENALSGQYTVELTGTGDGEYHMGVSTFTDVNDSTVIEQKSVVMGEKIVYTTTINTETGTVEEVSDPVIELPQVEKSAVQLTEELITDLGQYFEQGKIKYKESYTSLLNYLNTVLTALKKLEILSDPDRPDTILSDWTKTSALWLAQTKLNAFISALNYQVSRGWTDAEAAGDLINQAKAILSKIAPETDQPDRLRD